MSSKREDVVIKRSEQNKKQPLSTKVIGLSVLLLILVMVIAAVISNISGISVADIGSDKANGALIYDSLPESIRMIDSYSAGTVMLTDTAVEYIDSTGKKLSTNSHMYSQPVMKVNKSTVLLYDKGGTAFRIEKNSSIYNTYTTTSPITTASLGAKANYAYVLNDDGGYQSHLYVYSYQGEKQFEWGSASDYCITTALSDNGKSIAVAMLGVVNGEYVSKVSLFNFKDTAVQYTAELIDCTVYKLEFINNKTVVALTDNGIFVINKDGVYEKVVDYSPTELCHSFSTSGGLKAVAVARHGNSKDSDVIVFNKRYEENFVSGYTSEIFGIITSKNYVAVILGDNIQILNKGNENIGNIIIGEKCLEAVFSGRTLYVRTVSGIYSFDVDSDIDLTETTEEETTEEETTEEETTEEETTEEETTETVTVTTENTTGQGENSFG